jgi:hypothetical protein
MFSAALLLFLGVAWFMKDPVQGLWKLADVHGGLSKWEDRTVRVTSIERDCKVDEKAANEQAVYFESDSCDSSANLNIALKGKLRSEVMGQPCFDDGPASGTCPAVPAFPYKGTAIVTLAGVNKSDGEFTSQLRLTSDDTAYYVLKSGDVMKASVCVSNPSIARIKAHWAAVKGC